MLKVLVTVGSYIPGYKAGGLIRSVVNLVDWLGDEFEFYILTADRDLGDDRAYAGVQHDEWQMVGQAHVRYLSPNQMHLWTWHSWLQTVNHDVLYLNGFFTAATRYCLLLRKLGLVQPKPVILAPRGEFSPGALGLKPYKKKIYIWLVKLLGLYDNIIWQASSEYERRDILHALGYSNFESNPEIQVAPNLALGVLIHLAPDLTSKHQAGEQNGNSRYKEAGAAKVVFISRISRKKNLDYALNLLTVVKGNVQFDIYGPMEDRAYWKECQHLMGKLPSNVKANYFGPLHPKDIPRTFSGYHLFLFPTRGENFGHVILESLSAGCPVLLSDQTPWRGLVEKKAGWDLPLSKPEAFQAALDELIAMDQTTFSLWSTSARKVGFEFASDPGLVEANRRLFLSELR